eukprot:CAMPEP_0179448892 /NCGR_PEP_ID=MMETSP0799-20121207/32871_1 /TAXON_ID=46947 /ORGANISM="Geminigera cryophila, Strain CCMP2564" /LENGTH=54 /DNA_ID=CAMNT_0021241455 /DNA_START=19 /DNA_END=180 /DNA_ORIENTATION=+
MCPDESNQILQTKAKKDDIPTERPAAPAASPPAIFVKHKPRATGTDSTNPTAPP